MKTVSITLAFTVFLVVLAAVIGKKGCDQKICNNICTRKGHMKGFCKYDRCFCAGPKRKHPAGSTQHPHPTGPKHQSHPTRPIHPLHPSGPTHPAHPTGPSLPSHATGPKHPAHPTGPTTHHIGGSFNIHKSNDCTN